MNQTRNNRNLRETITSDENIYNAIYCMESYVFEKGLLNEDDLKLYYSLHDKFNFEFISNTISKCKKRLLELLDDVHELFDVTVYFKLKKLEINSESQNIEIKYRPMHTASLIDQICMVCMLLPLMFDDSNGKRKRSELSKIIPHDFYGNIPSDKVEFLFKPWINQYKSYSESIIEHCKEYRMNHRYNTEITLDIKDFFPSISPCFIFNYVKRKLGYVFPNKEDQNTLDLILTKLLIFKLDPDNLDGWENAYYGSIIPDSKDGFFTKGIAQGLPQSYFFGNLCMIEIRKKILSEEDFKQCDSYFYVDDSVIYIGQEYDEIRFKKTIDSINNTIASIGQYHEDDQSIAPFKSILTESQFNFQVGLDYNIKFYKDEKSEFCRIETAGTSIAGLEPLMRNASMAASIYSNVDEVEDYFSRDKLEKVCVLIDDEIKRLKEKIASQEVIPQHSLCDNLESRLKLIKRYKRFYLYRLRILERRLSDEITEQDVMDFMDRFNIPCFINECKLPSCLNDVRKTWFDRYDEDIFQSEARMLISMLPMTEAKKLRDELIDFERHLVSINCGTSKYLFFQQDFSATYALRRCFCNPYSSIARLVKEQISPIRSLSTIKQKEKFEVFVNKLFQKRMPPQNGQQYSYDEEWILPSYTQFIFENSDEYARIILNAYYSTQNEIEANDAKTFTKYSSRGLHYTELRILTRLRNRNFDLKLFNRALKDIDAKDLDNRMSIDMGLLEVINVFISKVKRPDWIDNIILTHRVVKGLWYNGSKFMNSYTLHNEEHAVTLIKAIVRIVKAIDYLNVKRPDYYILFLACYLHDVSMVIHPNISNFCNGDHESLSIISDFISRAYNLINSHANKDNLTKSGNPEEMFKKAGHILIEQFELVYNYFSNNIRSRHSKESADMIRFWQDSVLKHLSPLLLTHVAKVSESHGYNTDEVYGISSEARKSLVSEKYSMMLIRLADLMDVANDRINYNLLRQNVTHMPNDSKFHWISHLITDEIQVAPTYSIDTKANEPIENRKIKEYLNFNLFVNVKFLESVEKSCSKCRLHSHLDTDIVKLPPEYSDCGGIMLAMFGDGNNSEGPCPILCRWMVKKHEWFINELVALNSYLNVVNDRWFRTEIRFNIIYRDDFPLDKDLYDAVYDYINTNH